MALKSSREGLRKELVDYLGNIIIDKKLKQDIINSIDDVYVNENDVLSLEEIKASTDLSGKVTSASAFKYSYSILNNTVALPKRTGVNKQDIIDNSKYISSIIEPYTPRIVCGDNSGHSMFIGFTYEQSSNPNYAIYLYIDIVTDDLFISRCYNGEWYVNKFSGVYL